MRAVGRWYKEVQTLLLLVALAVAVGYWWGSVWAALTIVLAWRLLIYLWQLRRVLSWIDQPEAEPPEGSGVWGMMLDQMYAIQRHNRDARSRLQHTVDYLRDSFRSLRDGAVLIDQNGNIQWSNQSAERLLGLRYPQDKGQALLSLVRYPEFSSYLLDSDHQHPRVFATSGYPQRHFQVEVSSFGVGDRLILIRDVTRIVQIEQTRQDFIGNVSHELRTPLTVISGYLDTILDNDSSLPINLRKPLQQMSQQAERMENLVRDLLWLSKIEAAEGKRTDREAVSLTSLLAELLEELKTAYPTRNIERVISSDVKVQGDYRELYSAISNLLVNAIKYSSEGAPVMVSFGPDEAGVLTLTVKDSGLGIAEEHLPRLTERFYRVDESRSFAGGGTGLGLAIVKHVAASHNAILSIHSELGKGSEFSLKFPEASGASEAEADVA